MKQNLLPILISIVVATASDAAEPYHLLKEIPTGGDGGWDLLTIDEAGHRLYVSHATQVVVIDTDKDAVIGEITNTPGVHGIAIAPKLNRAFVSNGRSNTVSVVDLKTLRTISTVATGANPDAMLYEPSQSEVYAFNARGNSATVFAADSTNKIITTIELGSNPEFAVADPKAGRIYLNLEHSSEVVAIDIKTHQVVNRWPITPGEEATGMGFDAAHQRLFLGCANKMMVMMDATSGKIIASVPIGDGVDANAFDPATQLAFASCREGTVTIAHEDSPDKLNVVQTLPTARGSRTMALDSKTHKIYLPAAEYETPEQAPGATRQRPKMIAGSFKILVFGREATK
jgi:YVTN family beta-propeller protein